MQQRQIRAGRGTLWVRPGRTPAARPNSERELCITSLRINRFEGIARRAKPQTLDPEPSR
jgi:hypothetical protein